MSDQQARPFALPFGWHHEQPSEHVPGWLKHLRAEGARYHVLSWSNLGTHCSEPRCEINCPPAQVQPASPTDPSPRT